MTEMIAAAKAVIQAYWSGDDNDLIRVIGGGH